MVAYDLRLKPAKLNQVGLRRAKSLVTRFSRRTFNYSQTRCPVDTGNLRASGKIIPAAPHGLVMVGGVEYTAEYAAAVHEGRRAITVTVRRGDNGRFSTSGRHISQIYYPPRAGRPFLADALRKTGDSSADFTVTIG